MDDEEIEIEDVGIRNNFQLNSLATVTTLSSLTPNEGTNLVKNNDTNIKVNNENENTKINYPIKKYGRLITFHYINGDPQYALGKMFPLCFIFNCFFPIYAMYFLHGTVNYFYYLIGLPVAFFQIFMFTYTSITNPGLPKYEYENLIYDDKTNNFRQCKDCKFWISTDEGTQHCKICNICIEGYDHHCGLMNICIGKNNLKSFYLYVLGSVLMMGYFVIGFLIHTKKAQ